MSKRAWLLVVASAVIALAIGAIGTAAAVFDPDDYKPQIEASVQRATGRTLSLNGKLRLGLSLSPTISASDVTLANLPGGSRADMARAERIEARLSLLALLTGRLEVSQLTLVGPNIVFERVAGRPNWVFTPASAEVNAPAAPAGPARAAGAHTTLRFRRMHVQNGMVTWRLPTRTRVLGVRSLNVQRLTDSSPIALSGVLIHADQPFSVEAAAEPKGADTGPWQASVRVAANRASLQAKGVATLLGDYDLSLEGSAEALEALAPLLPEVTLPPLHEARFVTRLRGAGPDDLPSIGATTLHIGSADLGKWLRGLRLGAVDLSVPAAGAAASVTAAGSLPGQALTLAGQVGLPARLGVAASLPIDLALLSHDASGAASAGPSGKLALKGTIATGGLDLRELDATVSLQAPALAAFRPLLSMPLPALTDVSLRGGLALPADRRTLSLHAASLSTAQGDLAGEATIGLASPSLAGALRSTRLDLDALLASLQRPPVTAAKPGAPPQPAPAPGPPAAGPVIPDTPLPWAALRGPAIDLTLNVASLRLWQRAWQDVAAAVALAGGRLRIDRFALGAPAGPLSGSFGADASTDQVPVDLTLHAPAVPLALLAAAARLPGQTTGAVRLEAQLHGTGRSPHQLAASLDGTVAATMAGGSVSNAALLGLLSDSLKALKIKVPAEGQTAIRCLGLAGSFSKGVGTSRLLALDTTHLQLDGSGRVDLGAETLTLKLHPVVTLSGASVSVPVLVDGPFRAIHGRLDADGVAKAGLMIGALLGGDRPDICSANGLPASAR